MPLPVEAGPRLSEHLAELLQRIAPFLVTQTAWPGPLDAQGGLAPALRLLPLSVRYCHADPRTDNCGRCFRPELQRNPRLHRDKVQINRYRTYISFHVLTVAIFVYVQNQRIVDIIRFIIYTQLLVNLNFAGFSGRTNSTSPGGYLIGEFFLASPCSEVPIGLY